ncbi:hypothetical protein ACUN0C_15180 [Faunimonas sp. B44]|uniref:hypothetical protein n=1 Tax=Faunimonas sp. B44 TaxID=3461493 RepID=UPI004044CDC7
MKRLLWCGGSHLANAKAIISAIHGAELSDWEPDFMETAGPRFEEATAAGRQFVVSGSVVQGGGVGDRPRDLTNYDAIVFVGQYVQIMRAYSGPTELSTAVVEEILRHIPITLTGKKKWDTLNGKRVWDDSPFYNEPLDQILQLASCPVYLIHDPHPTRAEHRATPLWMKQAYFQRIRAFCKAQRLVLIEPPIYLVTDDLATRPEFDRGDGIHMNGDYWTAVLNEELVPRLLAHG